MIDADFSVKNQHFSHIALTSMGKIVKLPRVAVWRRPNFLPTRICEFGWVLTLFEHRFNTERIANGVDSLANHSQGKSTTRFESFALNSPTGVLHSFAGASRQTQREAIEASEVAA